MMKQVKQAFEKLFPPVKLDCRRLIIPLLINCNYAYNY